MTIARTIGTVQNNSAGTGSGFSVTGGECNLRGCVARKIGGRGFSIATGASTLNECTAWDCNRGGTMGWGGIALSVAGCVVENCISYSNASTMRIFTFR